jgi:hypothetical protein
MNLHGMYRSFGVVPQGLFEFFPVFFLVIFGALFVLFSFITRLVDLRAFILGFL